MTNSARCFFMTHGVEMEGVITFNFIFSGQQEGHRACQKLRRNRINSFPKSKLLCFLYLLFICRHLEHHLV